MDIPAWLSHAGGEDFPRLEGLDEAERNEKLYDVASKYYETITKHIRTYDSDHLIRGDRLNGNKGIPGPVLEAMKPFVDVLPTQYFTGADQESHRQMKEDFVRWPALRRGVPAGSPVGLGVFAACARPNAFA